MKNLVTRFLLLAVLLAALAGPGAPAGAASGAAASGATTELQILRYASDRTTLLAEKTITYQWMKENLPVHGDGLTHYYHQGPVFEGDPWDSSETLNLKDKGALKGTAVQDLCDLAGGMQPGDEVSFVAVDGWHTELAYANIYAPHERQGPVVLAWYNGAESTSGEKYGVGYPGLDGYHAALQIVFMAATPNAAGQYVFGNDDMRQSLPQEEYQHFYEGLPSTNGLSGKWISRLIIYSQQAPPASGAMPQAEPAQAQNQPQTSPAAQASPGLLTPMLWLILGLGLAGLGFIAFAFLRLRRDAQ